MKLLYLAWLRRENLLFCISCHKFENWQWPPFLGRGNFGGKLGRVVCLHTQRNGCHFWRVKYSLKLGKASLHRCHVGQKVCRIRSNTVLEIQAFFEKNSKIQNGRHFWEVKYSLKLGKDRLPRYPVDQIFCWNCSVSHSFRDTSIFVFCNFCEKFENSKWLPFFAGQNIFENWVIYSEQIPCGSKISLKSLFEIQGFLCFAFLKKKSKIKNGRHFWQVKYLLKLGKASLHRYPLGQKFCQNPTCKFMKKMG